MKYTHLITHVITYILYWDIKHFQMSGDELIIINRPLQWREKKREKPSPSQKDLPRMIPQSAWSGKVRGAASNAMRWRWINKQLGNMEGISVKKDEIRGISVNQQQTFGQWTCEPCTPRLAQAPDPGENRRTATANTTKNPSPLPLPSTP